MNEMTREIWTHAVVAKGKLHQETVYTLEEIPEATAILGCWIVNHAYESCLEQDHVKVQGQFDLNLWYSLDGNAKSAVYVKTLQYQEEIALHLIGDEQLDENCQLKTVFLSAPTCQKVDMQPDHTISMTIEKKLRTSVIKEVALTVVTRPKEDLDLEINVNFLENS